MVIITQSYKKLKAGYGPVIARELLLQCYEQSHQNVSVTARRLQCNRRTVMKTLIKQARGDLNDMSHRPNTQMKNSICPF